MRKLKLKSGDEISIRLDEKKKNVVLGIKTSLPDKTTVMVTVPMTPDDLNKMISELVTTKSELVIL